MTLRGTDFSVVTDSYRDVMIHAICPMRAFGLRDMRNVLLILFKSFQEVIQLRCYLLRLLPSASFLR